jgi:hypothetical protein
MNNQVHPLIGVWFLVSSLISFFSIGTFFIMWVSETTCKRVENVYDCNYVWHLEPADPEEITE